MKIYIENQRGEIYATIEVKNDKVIESSLKGVSCTDIDEDSNGLIYTLETQSPPYSLNSISNKGLLEEIQARLEGEDWCLEREDLS